MNLENEYCAKHISVPVNIPEYVLSNNLFHSAMASGCSKLPRQGYDLSSDDKEP
jgi:hypothetical protein